MPEKIQTVAQPEPDTLAAGGGQVIVRSCNSSRMALIGILIDLTPVGEVRNCDAMWNWLQHCIFKSLLFPVL